MSDQDQPAPREPSFGDSEFDDPAIDDPAIDDPEFDDPAIDDLRALLAETRVTEPIPADVAARLDARLESLQDERATSRKRASVVVLRRRVGRALVAAAAVAVIGAGSVGVLQSAREDADSGTSTADAGGDKAAEAPQDRDDAAPGSAPVEGYAGAASLPRLTSAHFTKDAAAAMRALSVIEPAAPAVPPAPSPVQTPATPDSTESRALEDREQAPPVTATPRTVTDSLLGVSSCGGPDAPDAVVLPATLDGVPVALVFRPPTASAQLVEAWSCDGSSLLASASVPR